MTGFDPRPDKLRLTDIIVIGGIIAGDFLIPAIVAAIVAIITVRCVF